MFLAQEGISHVVMDRSEFPRDKICGDALSGKVKSVLKKLDGGLVEQIEEAGGTYLDSWGVKFFAPNGKDVDIPFTMQPGDLEHAPGFVARRKDFDNFLVERLDPSYAHTLLGTRVRSIERNGERIAIYAEGKDKTPFAIHTRMVVGAEGERSITAKTLAGHELDRAHHCAGLRAYYKGVSGIHEQNFIELHFNKETLPGYFWIFPLPGGMANVGIGMLSSAISKRKVNLKKVLKDTIARDPNIAPRFRDAEPVDKVRGWGLPMGSKKRTLSGDGFLLTGDAASLIDPFTGEGIGNGMISAMIASRHIREALEKDRFDAAFFRDYDREVYQKLWQELKISHSLQKLAQHPPLFNMVVNKTRRNETLRETIVAMFENLNMRERLKRPGFYMRLLFN